MRRRRPPGGRFGAETRAGTEADDTFLEALVAKGARRIKRINRNRRALQSPRRTLRDLLADLLQAQAKALATQIHHAVLVHGGTTGGTTGVILPGSITPASAKLDGAELRKDDDGSGVADDVVDAILQGLKFDDWARIVPDVEAILVDVLHTGHRAGFAQIDVPELPEITAQANLEAIAWAHERAAELVGMRWDGNTLVPNPNAEWQITESTRNALRGDVVQALEEGWSNERLASELADAYAFSQERAATIARTETASADVEGNLEAYRASGEVAGKRWLLGSEHDGNDECDTAAAMGVVPLDDDFGGIGDPPAHPNCVCDLVPVLAEDS